MTMFIAPGRSFTMGANYRTPTIASIAIQNVPQHYQSV